MVTNYDHLKTLDNFEKFKVAYTYVEDNLDRLVGIYGKNTFLAVSNEIIGFDHDRKGLEKKLNQAPEGTIIIYLDDFLKKTGRSDYKQKHEYSN